MSKEPMSAARDGTGRLARPCLLAALVAVLATGLLAHVMPNYAPGLLRFEHALGDLRTAQLSDQLPSQHSRIAIVGITEETLKDYKAVLPIDRALLARIVDAVDAAGAKVIGIDVLFTRIPPADNEARLISAIQRAKAKVVMAAGDGRLRLSQAETERQAGLLAEAGRPAGYINLATERDWVVRFKATPQPGSIFQKSFAGVLAEAAGFPAENGLRRIAWLREPRDGSDTFLTIPAETLLRPAGDPLTESANRALKDKIVIIGGLLADVDRHVTPITSPGQERMPGAVVHGHIAAELVDGRGIRQLEDSPILHAVLALLAGLGFLIGWRYRLKRQGILLGSLATVVILLADTLAFWQYRIILPIVLALLAWFIGEILGHQLSRWFGTRALARYPRVSP